MHGCRYTNSDIAGENLRTCIHRPCSPFHSDTNSNLYSFPMTYTMSVFWYLSRTKSEVIVWNDFQRMTYLRYCSCMAFVLFPSFLTTCTDGTRNQHTHAVAHIARWAYAQEALNIQRSLSLSLSFSPPLCLVSLCFCLSLPPLYLFIYFYSFLGLCMFCTNTVKIRCWHIVIFSRCPRRLLARSFEEV